MLVQSESKARHSWGQSRHRWYWVRHACTEAGAEVLHPCRAGHELLRSGRQLQRPIDDVHLAAVGAYVMMLSPPHIVYDGAVEGYFAAATTTIQVVHLAGSVAGAAPIVLG